MLAPRLLLPVLATGLASVVIAAPAAHAVAPGTPQSVVVVPGPAELVVSWAAPASAGDSAITSYTAVAKVGSTTYGSCTTASTSCAIEALTNGTAYTVEVTATNGSGPGTAATSSGTPVGVPSAPQHVTVSGSASGARVAWAAPATDGGSAVLDYVAEAYSSASGGTAVESCSTISAAEVTCQIEPLTSGATYYVTVYAVNATGNGVPATRIPMVAGATPSIPRSVTASRVSSGIDVAWLPPAESGGSSVTSYTARAYTSTSSAADAVATCTTSGLGCTITGLSTSVHYYVSVAATNASGEGHASSRLSVPIAQAPGAPRSVAVTRGNGFAHVQWSAPSSTGGSSITRYVVRAYDSLAGGTEVAQCSPSTTRLECNVGPLPNGSTYYVDVTATNHYGDGAASSPRSSVRPGADSSPPRNVTAQQEPEGIDVHWDVPLADGGYSITGYTARAWTASTGGTKTAECRSSGDQCFITPASEAPVYIDVVAQTALGPSAPSAPRVRVVLVDPIDAPTAVTVTSGRSTWDIDWREPEDASKGEVIEYRATILDTARSVVGECSLQASKRGDSKGCSVPAVRGSGDLTVSVSAQTPDSRTSSLPVSLGKRGDLPIAPNGVIGAPGSAAIDVQWQPPGWQGTTAVTSYRVRAWSKAKGGRIVETCSTPAADAASCVVTGLTDFEPVWVDVTARNGSGWGAPSTRVRLEPRPSAPEALSHVIVAPTSDGFSVRWSADPYDGGYAIRRYVARATSDEAGENVIGGCSTESSGSRCSIEGLAPGTHAWIFVAAVNTVGTGTPVVIEGTVPFA